MAGALRIMFGRDYPVLKHGMMYDRRQWLRYSEEVLHRNAEAYFPNAAES